MNKKIQIALTLFLLFSPVLIKAQDIFNKVRKCESIVYKNRYSAFDSILIYAEEQFKLAEQLEDSLELGKAHLSLAYAHYNLDNDGECLYNLLEARRIFKLIGNGSQYAISTLEMASMFREGSSEYFKPDSLLHNSISYFENHNMNTYLSRAYLELGLNFRNKYKYNIGRDSIIYYYTKAAYFAERGKNQELYEAAINDIADYYLLKPHRNLDTVIYLSSKVLSSSRPIIRNQAVAALNTHLALKMQGNPENTKYLKEGYNMAIQVKPARLPSQAGMLLYNYYKQKEMYDSALYYYQKSNRNPNSKKTSYALLLMEAKEKEADEIELRNSLLASNLKIQKNLNSTLIFAFLILVIFIVMIINNNKIIKRKNEDLRKEKDYSSRLLKEIHHRVKNNLQMVVGLLDLQQSSAKSDEISLVLNDAGSRVKSIALIHQSLYKGNTDMVSVGFDKYISELCESLIYSYNMSNKLDVNLDIDNIKIPFNRAVILGLLITELVTNVLKHAFKGKTSGELNISIKHSEKNVILIVSDNGVGLPDDINDKDQSFGLDLINSFVSDLKGEMEFYNNNGATIKVTFDDLELN